MRNVRRQTIKSDLSVIFVAFCANPFCTISRTGCLGGQPFTYDLIRLVPREFTLRLKMAVRF